MWNRGRGGEAPSKEAVRVEVVGCRQLERTVLETMLPSDSHVRDQSTAIRWLKAKARRFVR